MSHPIKDHALIGDLRTAALVARDGSIDWLCVPRFDSGAVFAALRGEPGHGRWRISPAGEVLAVRRSYRSGSLVLATEFDTDDGTVRLVDGMLPGRATPSVVRMVEGVRGRVAMRMELVVRFDYGSIVPWVRRVDGRLHAVAGPDALHLDTDVETRGEGLTTVAAFTIQARGRIPFSLSWSPSNEPAPAPPDARAELEAAERCGGHGPTAAPIGVAGGVRSSAH